MKMNGFVYIIESPSNRDLLDERTEGRVLREALKLANIDSRYSLATNLEMFKEALYHHLTKAWYKLQKPPIIHLSMHGDKNGIQLTSKEDLTWHELNQLLLPLKQYINGGFLICMSSCEGFYGFNIDMNHYDETVLFALVGNKEIVDYHDAAVAYITFYHLFFKEHLSENSEEIIKKCVQAMNFASGNSNFDCIHGYQVKMWNHIQTYIFNQNQQGMNFMGN